MSLHHDLRQLRAKLARQEGVEPYFVLHNKTIEEIVRRTPQTADELAGVKGLGPKKITKYGAAIMAVVRGEAARQLPTEHVDAVVTVARYIARLNDTLAGQPARLRGEVGKINVRENVMYFDFRDPSGEAVLSCLVFTSRYRLMGVELREGLEVIISGTPSVWPRSGRLSFHAGTIELVGEGKLQQAYAALKRTLDAEGLFAPERKRAIPRYAERIGLITSSQADAYFDFVKNLLPAGLMVEHADCHVEGARAVPEIIRAFAWFQTRPVDVIVMVRGGGSWESLQAFNNEAVCRAVAGSRAPVLAGIGHERDVPLAALAADRCVSTPSITAIELSHPWREAPLIIERAAQTVGRAVELDAIRSRDRLNANAQRVQLHHRRAMTWAPQVSSTLASRVAAMRERLLAQGLTLDHASRRIAGHLRASVLAAGAAHRRLEQIATARDPQRLLQSGYSIVRSGQRIVRSSRQLSLGDPVSLQLGVGGAAGTITNLTPPL